MPLIENLQLGEAAAIYARALIQYSSTFIESNATQAPIDMEKTTRVLTMRSSVFSPETGLKQLYRVPDMRYCSEIDKIKRSVTLVKQFSIGNCEEYAMLVLNYLRKQNIEHAEALIIQGDDHGFVVIGRTRGSDLALPSTWGDDAVVCDAWANKVYPASQIFDRLMCFRAMLHQHLAYPFDPKQHTLKILVSIGGNDCELKARRYADGILKLKWIRKVVLPIDHPEKDALLDQIARDSQDFATSMASIREGGLESISNTMVERDISKRLRQHVKRCLDLANGVDNKKMLVTALIKCWVHNISNAQNDGLPMMKTATYFHLLKQYDNTVAHRVLRQMSKHQLNRVISERRDVFDSTLLHVLLKNKNEALFLTILSRISTRVLDDVDDRTFARVHFYQKNTLKLLHLAALNQLRNGFTALLAKHSQPTLDAVAGLSIAICDKKLAGIVLQHLGIAAFFSFLDQLSVAGLEASQAAEVIKSDLHLGPKKSIALLIEVEKMQHPHAKQFCVNQLLLRAGNLGYLGLVEKLLNISKRNGFPLFFSADRVCKSDDISFSSAANQGLNLK